MAALPNNTVPDQLAMSKPDSKRTRRLRLNPHSEACRTQDYSASTVPENRNQRRPNFTAFSLPVPDMRVKIDKICPRSSTISLPIT
jgi:hypothetical protein